MTSAGRYDAFVALMAQRDPADLPKRGRVYTQPGDLNPAVWKERYAKAWLQHRLQDHDGTVGIVSVRRTRLRLMRTA